MNRFGFRTVLATPLLRDSVAIGAIVIRRIEVRPFTDNADQAPRNLRRPSGHRYRERAAVQGTRRRNRNSRSAGAANRDERDPGRHRQLADGHAAGAGRVCRERRAALWDRCLIRRSRLHVRDRWRSCGPHSGPTTTPIGRANAWQAEPCLMRRTMHVHDLPTERNDFQIVRSLATGARLLLATPLLRGGLSIGSITASAARRCARSQTSKSHFSKPSLTKRSSPSRTCGCSRNWRSEQTNWRAR